MLVFTVNRRKALRVRVLVVVPALLITIQLLFMQSSPLEIQASQLGNACIDSRFSSLNRVVRSVLML